VEILPQRDQVLAICFQKTVGPASAKKLCRRPADLPRVKCAVLVKAWRPQLTLLYPPSPVDLGHGNALPVSSEFFDLRLKHSLPLLVVSPPPGS